MSDYRIFTFDWVPELPRGFVRDLRIRWALEEAGFSYSVESTPFRDRGEAHLAHQPFGQVPWLVHGDKSIFESGAILLHLGEASERLLPPDPESRQEVTEWVFAALNSVEMAALPWTILKFTGDTEDTAFRRSIESFLDSRLHHMEALLTGREWLTASFSIADILMADVLRLIDRFEGLTEFPACRAYVARCTERPAFRRALDDQMAHFSAAD